MMMMMMMMELLMQRNSGDMITAAAVVLGTFVFFAALFRASSCCRNMNMIIPYVGSRRRNLPLAQPKLPEGSSWLYLPFVGESLIFFRDGPLKFFSHRIARYGPFFRTYLMGTPTIVASTPKAASFVLGTNQNSFGVFYPPSILRLVGLASLPTEKMSNSPSLEFKVLYDSLRSDSLKNKHPKVDKIVRWALNSWDSQPPSSSSSCNFNIINTHKEAEKIAYHIALYSIAGMWPSRETMKIVENFDHIVKGMATPFQFNIPGTLYHIALEKRKPIVDSFVSLVKTRLLTKEKQEKKCVLDSLMEIEIEADDGRKKKISKDRLVSWLFGFVFGGSHTSAAFFVWLVKFLAENQHILEQVKVEQDKIKEAKSSSEDPLSWIDITNNMPLSSAVIQETLRLAGVTSFITRKVVEDVNYEGILIPKGWLVKLAIGHFHLSPEYHKEPLKFDPSRFQESVKPMAYMPFGNGSKMCPGRELLKVEALVFLHYLVTTYRWEIIGSKNGADFWPIQVPKGGLPIKVVKLH